uniref:C-C motif chemokine n=1 Tax=Electrophorus electricus TaxID=8005 RepID=A0A4W4E3I0_ELEEL
MRNLSALLFVLLLCSLQLVSSPALNLADCCYKPTQNKLPLKRIVSYNWTRSDCSIKAVVFKTVAGKQFCVNPDAVWVSSHVVAVDTLVVLKVRGAARHTT